MVEQKDTQYTRWSSEFEKKFDKIQEKVNRLVFKMSMPESKASEMKNEASNKFYLNAKLSFSDTSINYEADYDKNEEASAGSAGLINLDGTLNLNMILKGAHSVVLKENSNKICDLTLNILENLINIDILPTQEIEMKIEQAKSCMVLSPSSHAYLNELEKKYNENVYLAADLVLKWDVFLLLTLKNRAKYLINSSEWKECQVVGLYSLPPSVQVLSKRPVEGQSQADLEQPLQEEPKTIQRVLWDVY